MGKSTRCHAERTMVTGGVTMTTSLFSVRNSLQLIGTCSLRLSPEGEERDILRDIRNANRAGRQEDAVHGRRRPPEIQREIHPASDVERDGLLCFRTASMFQ